MGKLIFFLILLFPTLTFGQSFTGNYRAIFFILFSEPKTIIAEFEVKTDNSLNGKIKIDTTVKDFMGTVDKKGKFEAVIEQVGNFSYKLKGKFDKDNKISLVQRNQVGSGLNKSVSETSLEGTFAKFEKPTETASPTNPVELNDNGKSWLKIKHPNHLFGTDWANFTAQVSGKMNGNTDSWEIQVLAIYPDGEQKMTILFPKFFAAVKVWKSENFDLINYLERKTNVGRNSFASYADIYKQNPQLAGGTLELVRESATQMIFKVSNLKIKRVGKPDFVEINGFIYAEK